MDRPGRATCRLAWRFRERRGELFVDSDLVAIGRSSRCELVVPDASVSRRHAEILRIGAGFVVRDAGSTNGVLVNGARVSEHRLADGDRLAIGALQARCRIDEAPLDAAVSFADEPESAGVAGLEQSMLDVSQFTMPPLPAASLAGAEAAPDLTQVRGRSAAWIARPLREAAEALLSDRDLDLVLRRYLRLVAHHLGAERGVIALRDDASGEIAPRAVWVAGGISQEPITISRRIRRVALETQQAILVRDTAADARFETAESIRAESIRSAMCAPLAQGGQVGGLVYVDTRGASRPFTEESLEVLAILSTLAAVAVEESRLRDGLALEQRIRAHLSRYSSPAVVGEIVRRGEVGGDEPMRCEEREITVLFCDFAGFTAYSEKRPPAEVSATLNAAFDRLCAAVFAEDGTLDKFTGDGMMVFFGAPVRQADHAQRAVRAALRMQQALAELGPEKAPFGLRVGINTGPAIVGDLGTPARRDYTAIGNTVNVASRLESKAARSGDVVIGPATHALVAPEFDCVALPPQDLKGLAGPIVPYRVSGPRSPAPSAEAGNRRADPS